MRVSWTAGTGLPDQATVFDTWRKRPVAKEEVTQNVGDASAALEGSARRVKATYDFAVQTHATIGPSCAVADFQDGKLTVWTSSQATHSMQHELAVITGLSREAIRLVFIEGAGCYGRNGTEDAAADAALIATLIGKPVRVQWSRADETARAPKSPPRTMDLEAGLDAQGNVVAWTGDFYIALNHIAAFKPLDFPLLAATETGDSAAGQLGRLPVPEFGAAVPVPQHPGEHAAHCRDVLPLFAPAQPGADREQLRQRGFMDELAAAAQADPAEFRLRYLKDQRAIDVVQAAMKLAGWQARPGPNPNAGSGPSREGTRHRLPSLQQRHHLRGGGRRSRGRQAHGRDPRHPRLRKPRLRRDGQSGRRREPGRGRRAADGQPHAHGDGDLGPQQGDERRLGELPDHAPYRRRRRSRSRSSIVRERSPGARASRWPAPSRPAIANAVFDATGARLRSVPFTPDKVKAALAAAQPQRG